MKGILQADHVGTNTYSLKVVGLPVEAVFTKISGIEDELEVAQMPDRTQEPGGRSKPGTFTVNTPLHHTAERVAMEIWYKSCHDPVLPTCKLTGVLAWKRISGSTEATYNISGLFPGKRKLPEADMNSEGDLAEIEWTMAFDSIDPTIS